MFISILIYFELKYFVRYGKITLFWVLLQVLLQEVTTILFVNRFVNQSNFISTKQIIKKKCAKLQIQLLILIVG